ncbi:hypothetical protein [Paraflavitalea pollutisoli]|uniref:hypothetical protein n=1 Tax=Paraflavitalea pollutisoli TaxID=3034143 RepID=UPI0023EC0159|nr:hypothetical protein [Paraflavitalea sp. H1-2-19X]
MKKLAIPFFLVLFAISLTHCSKNNTPAVPATPDLKELLLKDFPLSEVTYRDISITDPVIENGQEKTPGKILISIPYSHRSLQVSLKQFDSKDGRYAISPSIGVAQNFANSPITYTVSFNSNPALKLRYQVTVVYGGEPYSEKANIIGFSFEKSQNPALGATIEATKVVDYENSSEAAIYVIVPAGTDFSKLVPTVTYEAAKLYYRTDGSLEYYKPGAVVNFKYPARYQLQAENSLGVKSKLYEVIVDVKDPIQFEQTSFITQKVKTGNGSNSQLFANAITWTNVGNRPITAMLPAEYIEKTLLVGMSPTLNVITTNLVNPVSGTIGVLPGEKGKADVKVLQTSQQASFTTKAIFKPVFRFDNQVITALPSPNRVEALYNPVSITINSTVEN